MALPPLNLFPVLLISVPGLLGLVAQAPSRRSAFWRGYVFGVAHQMCGIYWITSAVLVEAADYWWLVPFAVPLLAVIVAVLTGLPCMLAWHARGAAGRALTLAGAWVLADLARQFIATGFPWNLWGSVLELPGRAGDVLIQAGSLIGIHGLTLCVLLLAATPTLGRRARWAGVAGFAALIGFGLWRVNTPAPPPTGIYVALIQGDVAEGQKWDRALARQVFNRYLALSRTALAAAPPGRTVLVWPETASPYLLGEDPAAREAIAAAERPDTAAFIGSVRFDGATPYNSLFALAPGPSVAGIYDKWHLVPFGEYQPGWLPGIQLVAGRGGFGFGPGPHTLTVPGVPPAEPLICYEAAFSGQITPPGGRPAWLLAVTNDAWFGNSSGPRQHLQAARMRAVETGLPLLRAANTGITAAFDSLGHEFGRVGLGRAGTLTVSLPGARAVTLYDRLGLWEPAVISLALVFAGMLKRRPAD